MSEPQHNPAKVTIYPGVRFGRNVRVHDFCVIGMPSRGKEPGEVETVIGDNATIRPFTTIYAGARIGADFQCGQGVTIREKNVIGDNCSVGSGADLENGNRIASNVRIHSKAGIEQSVIEEHVLIGPYALFLGDPHPVCPRYDECVGGAVVKHHARVGGLVIVNPGVTIGENSLIGSGTLVNSDVPANTVFFGHPGKPRRRI